ncbi:SPOR domain-containing protein [Starkeya koreensis]|uniref:SPOR domain-containing protein n=1 Tax=Ancylobacter koreensis TaxID=266121 RepID=A0ABT0DME5_9HYPH|nr:SPOR domain-containing protein [Ancylobacter koreensis]MCK0208374.1 SPOR domain-containing protein [Ancylobacter koreensis]
MANETMRNRPEVPAEDPLAELARLMGQEDEFGDLLRQAHAAPDPAARRPAPPAPQAPSPQSAAPRAPQPRPATPRAPEPGRPAPGSFAALAAEVYNEGARHSSAARSPVDDSARDLGRPPRPQPPRPADPRLADPRQFEARQPEQRAPEYRAPETRIPDPRAADPRAADPRAPQERTPQERAPQDRAPFVPPRPQPTEPPRRSAPAASQPEAGFDRGVNAVSRALAQSFDPLPETPRAAPPRPEPARPEQSRPEAARADASRIDAAHADILRGAAPARASQARDLDEDALPPAESRLPSWMQREGTRAPAPTPAQPAARGPAPQPGQPFDLDEESYDYGRSAADYNPADAYDSYEVEDEVPERRGRRRLLLVGGLIAVFVVAAAAGYMLVGGHKGTLIASGEPPVIRAEQGPNKVVPAQPAKEPATSDGQKLIYDRVGGNATTGNEQVVSSEEQPVDMSQAAQPQPRVITTAPAYSGSSSQAGGNPNAAEPKRVRTLTVRADGTIVEDSPPPSPPPSAAPVQSSAQPTSTAPIPLNTGSGGPVSTNPTPLSATPSIVDNVPAPARVAAAPAMPAAVQTPAAAPRPAAAPASAAGATAPAGAYVVQIASVRSEAEAQATWRSMQSKYAGLLANQPFGVKRADLGDRGVYYRAQVGSFGSRDEAVSLCEALRAQGGDCMVQRN